MATVTMPQLGETVTEGTITRWLKQEGDEVAADELLFEVSTDKVDSEVPSPYAGVLSKIIVAEGETVDVGVALCEIAEAGAESAAAAPPPETATPEEAAPAAEPEPAEAGAGPEPAPAAEPARVEPTPSAAEPAQAPAVEPAAPDAEPDRAAGDGDMVLSPVVRRLAKENNVDLSKVKGTGAGGRITREDVLAFMEGKSVAEVKEAAAPPKPAPPAAAPAEHEAAAPAPAPQPAPAEAPARAPAAEPVAPAAEPASPAAEPASPAAEPASPAAATAAMAGQARVEALPVIRQRIAEHMFRSKNTSAHVFSAVEVDMEAVEQVRRNHRDAFRAREGFGLTYLSFIARAVVDALAAYPAVNASVDLEQKTIAFHDYVNLGIAVDLDEKGLIVPVVKRADEMTVVGLARRIRELGDKAKSRQLSPDDVVGSTFTITNPGPFGSLMSAPVINQPNVAILSTEAVEKRVVVVDDMIAIRHRMYLCMSWDHRAFDGSTAVKFLARCKENIETWDWEAQLS